MAIEVKPFYVENEGGAVDREVFDEGSAVDREDFDVQVWLACVYLSKRWYRCWLQFGCVFEQHEGCDHVVQVNPKEITQDTK